MIKPLSHTGSVMLETTRLILRPTRLDDAENMFANWAGDPKVTKYLMSNAHPNLNTTKETLNSWNEQSKNSDFYNWGMELKGLEQLLE